MQIILTQDVEHVGKANDLVKVKPGYGRNYLIPKGMAVLATKGNMKQLEERRKQAELRYEKVMSELRDVVAKFEGKTVQLGAKVGQSGKIFGSITNIQMADAIKKQFGVDVDRKNIEIPEDVKELGSYTAKVGLHKDLSIDVAFEVVSE
jgi:large subunit ribosomal protein L9